MHGIYLENITKASEKKKAEEGGGGFIYCTIYL